jgi:glycosyltransferase involved in cell wall biosynthesis
MKILMISPQFRPIVGGYERAAERLSKALSEKGHEVMVCAERRHAVWARKEELDGVLLHRWWCIYRPGWHILTSLAALFILLLRYGRNYNVWHVHQYGMHAALAIMMGKFLHRPVVLKSTSTKEQGLKSVIAKGKLSVLVAALHRRSDAVVALTRETAAEAESFGIPKERIHVLGNGVDTETYRLRGEIERKQLKRQLGLGKAPVVIFVGRLTEAKNIEGLMKAWQLTVNRLPVAWQLVVVGDGPLLSTGMHLAKEFGISDSVQFVGQQPNVEQWMGAADLYVSTSWREGLSNTLLEAMATGLPVVVTRVSGVPELVEATGAGEVVETGDMEGISEALTALICNKEKRDNCRTNGRNAISRLYSIKNIASKYHSLYGQLCNEIKLNFSETKKMTGSYCVSNQLGFQNDKFSRILMFVPQYPYPVVGGLERQSHELSKALIQIGVNVQVISGMIIPEHSSFDIVEGVPVTRIKWSQRKSLRFLFTSIELFLLLWSKRHSFDVIHLHQHSWVGLFTILCAKILHKPVLTKLPNVGDYGLHGLRKDKFGQLKIKILLMSDGLIAMSQASVNEIRKFGFPEGRILRISNGICLRHMSSSSKTMTTRSNPSCKVVFVGRLMKQKRLYTLLDAWKKVVDFIDDRPILEIWGEGPLLRTLKKYSEQLEISWSVKFCGHINGVRKRLHGMDVFVLPSVAEGNSNAILEAMDAGLPVVSTLVGGTPMLVGKNSAGLLFKVDDTDALASILYELMQNVEKRRQIGRAMRIRVETYFDINKIALKYLSAYCFLCQGRGKCLGSCSKLPF